MNNKKKRVLAIFAIIILLMLSFFIYLGANAASVYYVRTTSSDRSYGGFPSADFTRYIDGVYLEEYAGKDFSVCEGQWVDAGCTNIVETFCVDPGIYLGAEMNSVDNYNGFKNAFYPNSSGGITVVPVTSDMKNSWSILVDYYTKNRNDVTRAAVQALIWEVSTKGRTSFSSDVPNGYSGSDSFYTRYVASGGYSSFASAYTGATKYVREYFSAPTGTSTSSSSAPVHELTYNSSSNQYTKTITSSSPMSYYSCSAPAGVTLTKSGNNITVSTSNLLTNNTLITCTRGNGGHAKVLYSSVSGGVDLGAQYSPNYQRFIAESGAPSNTIYFNVKSSTIQFKVTKQDENGTALNGATFTLSNGSKSYTIAGNSTTAILVEPGTYTLSETVVPPGYKKMNNVSITIPATSGNSNPYLSGDTTVYVASNTPLKLEWQKKNSETNATLDNVGFKIYKWNGTSYAGFNVQYNSTTKCYTEKYDGTGTNSSNLEIKSANGGKVCLEKPTAGSWYKIVETSSLPGYASMIYNGEKTEQFLMIDNSGKIYKGGGAGTSTTLPSILYNVPLKMKWIKKDSVTGEILKTGIEFSVTKNSNQVKFLSKDTDGCYTESASGTVTKLVPNTSDGYVCIKYVSASEKYIVEEVTVPSGYQKMENQTITAPTLTDNDATTLFEFKNIPLKLEWQKKNSETNANLDNVGFKIYKWNGTSYVGFQIEKNNSTGCYTEKYDGTGTNSSNLEIKSANGGKVCLEKPTAGSWYKIVETSSLPGYASMIYNGEKVEQFLMIDNSGKVYKGGGAGTSTTLPAILYNVPLKIIFYKQDSDTGAVLKNGVEFSATKNSKQVKFLEKDKDGCYTESTTGTITKLVPNTSDGSVCMKYVTESSKYTIEEVTVPVGYQKMPNQTITAPSFSAEKTSVTFRFKDTPLIIKFHKEDSETGEILKSGIEFSATKNSKQVKFLEKDKDGCYTESTTGTITKLVPNTSDGNVCMKYVTESSKYIIEEVTVPVGYQKMKNQTITAPTLTDEETIVTFKFKNTPLKIKFYKEDSTTNERINNAGFTIYKNNAVVKFNARGKDGCYKENVTGSVTEVYTDTSVNNGEVCLSYVTSGSTYTVEETTIPTGYQKMKNASITAKKNTDVVNLTETGLTNTPLEIKFYKEDSETGKRINNAGFTVYKNNAVVKFNARDSRGCYKENATGSVTEVYTDTSVNNGEVCLSYVTSGSTYKVVETTVPTGYRKMPAKEIVAKKNTDAVNLTNAVLKETPLYMYFSKEDSDKKTPIIGAEFEVHKYNKDTKKYDSVKFTQKTGEDCYIEDASGSITKLNSKNITIKSIEEDGTQVNKSVPGGVCLKYVSADTMYKVIETNPIDRYTFFKPEGEVSGIKMKVNHQGAQTNYNLDETARGDSKMKNYPTMLEFEKKASDDGDSKDSTITKLIDGALFEIVNKNGTIMTFEDKGNGLYEYSASGTVTRVHTTNRKFIVKYLPWGEYNVREVEESSPNGYYYNPDLSKFTITKYTNGQVEKMDQAKANIIDKPVVITFTKTDIYNYYSAEDKAKLDSEEKLFDTAKFVIKDNKGNILKLKYVGQNETEGNIYRYLPVDSNNTNEKINTYKGKLKITHLMNNTKYVIEEVESMEGFILPNNHPKKEYNIQRKEPASKTDSSITQVIENTPTRIRIEKRDLKTGYLIDDEKVTFELYKVETTGNLTRIYVDERKWLADAKGNLEYAYTYSKLNAKTNERITTYGGVIVIRYLPKGSYVLKEIESPEGYDLPVGEGAKTYFDVSGETTEVETEVVKNKPSKIIIRKYSEEGYLITGARFKIYKVRNYDPNLSAKNQEKELIKLKTIRQGEYENKEVRDTEEITTCEENCEIIGTETKEAGIIKSGELIVQYLETENYYVIEETEAPEGYQLPENPYNIVYLKESVEDVDAEVVIENEYTPVTFYKYDEYNKLLDGAEYKLQILNNNKKYIDVNVSKMEEKEGSVYAVDYNSETSTITTTNGSATIYMLAPGQYRVLETKAPFGYELPKASVNVATFFVTDEGKTKGDFIISNKKPTTTKTILNSATSELVINIQTGQKVMKYIGIIIGLLTGIGILMFIVHKMNKKA